MATKKKVRKVLYFESTTRGFLKRGFEVEVAGQKVKVGKILDCGRMSDRTFWWFYAA